ncbi:hypothetical protein ALC62_10659, partial [Cyphomyrmex costatus]
AVHAGIATYATELSDLRVEKERVETIEQVLRVRNPTQRICMRESGGVGMEHELRCAFYANRVARLYTRTCIEEIKDNAKKKIRRWIGCGVGEGRVECGGSGLRKREREREIERGRECRRKGSTRRRTAVKKGEEKGRKKKHESENARGDRGNRRREKIKKE